MPHRIWLPKLAVLGALALLPAIPASPAEAQSGKGPTMDRAKLQSLLPTSNIGTSADLANNYTRLRITPLGDPKLSFAIPVHTGWQSRPFEADPKQLANDDKGLVPLAFITPDSHDAGVSLEVRYMRVPEKATLERFLEQYPKLAGFTVLGRQNGEFNGRVVEEALMRMETKDFGPILTRLAATRKGDRILVVAGSAPEGEYEKLKNIFAVAIVGFDPDPEAGSPGTTTTGTEPKSGVTPVMASGNLKLQSFTWEQNNGGAARAVAPYKPGDNVYAKYELTGYAPNPRGQIEVALSVVCTDPAGLALAERWNDVVRGRPAHSINGSFHIHLPPYAPAGAYTLAITAQDKAKNVSANFSRTFVVQTAAPILAADHLEVRDFRFSHSQGGDAMPIAEYRSGQSVYYHFDLFGMKFREDRANVHIAYKVLSPSGEAVFDKPDWENLRDAFVYHPANFFVPINGYLTLPSTAGPGTYTQQFVITDNNASVTITQRTKFSTK